MKKCESSNTFAASGFCRDCDQEHGIVEGAAAEVGRELMKRLLDAGRLDIDVPESEANANLSLDYLYGPARGQMFGVLLCENKLGEEVILKAFSCQFNGVWQVPGWVPPILDMERYDEIVPPVEKRIKELGREMESLEKECPEYKGKKRQRKELSQNLMKEIHNLYQLFNFRKRERPLEGAFILPKGIPTGTAECCAPKLLQYAALNELKPVGLAEFYLGQSNRSGTREQGQFYRACPDKCQPILGFMLCGVESL